MIQIFKKVDVDTWQAVEDVQNEALLAQRLAELRQDESEYRAEKKDGSVSSILDV